ncbi:ubiquinol-cytochrome c reductase complex assembly factor 2 isoform X1 [Ovis canadensis]|uniref:ubiquinol-cytochrome c reductase complex assembly factor 2 isoform X1 n=1 Tax=Ovis canadensis TaxID=37174 RepID=UPI003751BC77
MASGRDQTGPGLGRLSAAAGSAGLSGGREHPVAGKTGPEWEALLCSVFVPVEGSDRQSCSRPRGSLHLNGWGLLRWNHYSKKEISDSRTCGRRSQRRAAGLLPGKAWLRLQSLRPVIRCTRAWHASIQTTTNTRDVG